jgi:hypothetical protein
MWSGNRQMRKPDQRFWEEKIRGQVWRYSSEAKQDVSNQTGREGHNKRKRNQKNSTMNQVENTKKSEFK